MLIPKTLELITQATGEKSTFAFHSICVHGNSIYATDGKIAVAVSTTETPISPDPVLIPHAAWGAALEDNHDAELTLAEGVLQFQTRTVAGHEKTIRVVPDAGKFPPINTVLTTQDAPEYEMSFAPSILRRVCEIADAHQSDSDSPRVTLRLYGPSKPARLHAGYDSSGNIMDLILMPLNLVSHVARLSEEDGERLKHELSRTQAEKNELMRKNVELVNELKQLRGVIAAAVKSSEEAGEPGARG